MYSVSYIGDGVTTEYDFSFPFFQVPDVRVRLNDALATDVPVAFSVVPNEDFTGGRVVFATAPARGDNIEIFRRISLSRVIDYQPTAPIDPESLNADFNFLLAAFQDFRGVEFDLTQWETVHAGVVRFLEYTNTLIQDKLTGGGALGVYNNLLTVLASAQPYLINDYGSVAEPAPNENRDDYGIL